MKPKLTRWFDHPRQKPFWPGVYLGHFGAGGDPWFRRWDGRNWYCGQSTIDGAAKEIIKFDASFKWRGLAERPTGSGEELVHD